ncbi:helix-turn-helix domain-containing protein [Bordetella bronchialis]|uniref:helix-turn-helix domain-containing protein n=1 Tax=Bordetella bronchialis TaxID=463025 RepID=UPI003D0593AB
MESFGQRVRQARIRRGWTQKQLADASGLTQSAIGNYESGQRVEPTAAALLKLAKALRVPPAWLGGGSPFEDALQSPPARTPRGLEATTNPDEGVWPFRKVAFEAYAALTPSQKRMLESLVVTFISSCAPKP